MKFAEIRGSGLGSVIAENNSTKYYIKVTGSHSDLATENRISEVVINDSVISVSPLRGMNIQRFDNNMQFVESRSFDLYGSLTEQSSIMSEYIRSVTSGVLILYSYDAMGNNTVINELMKIYGASAWPWHINSTKRFAWCGIIDCKNSNMISDAMGGLGNSYFASLDYYIDTMEDMGVTGAGNVIIQDPNEYSGKQYLVKTYMEKTPLSELKQLKVGEWIYLRADLMHDNESVTNKITGVMTVQFYDQTSSYLKGITIRSNSTSYKTIEARSDIPANAFYVDIKYLHSPSGSDGTGTVSIKNVVVQPIAKEIVKNKPARLGRYTAPAREFREGTTTGNTVVRFTKDELIEASEMQEILGNEWIKVFEHRTLNGPYLFEDLQQALYSEIPYLYSNMKEINDFRLKDGKWRFKLVYDEGHIVWEQSSSPELSSVTGLKIIETTLSADSRPFGGIRRTVNDTNSRYDCNTGSTWYYAIGAIAVYGSGFPGPKGTVNSVQLYAWKE